MISLFELLSISQLEAVEAKLNPTEASVWRSIERKYSTTFSTPLHEVSKLDPLFVISHVYENQLENYDLDDEKELQEFLNILYKLEDPDYDAKREQDEEEYNKKAVREEEARLKRIAAKKAAKNNPPKELPKAGGINLSYLADNQENEG